MVTGNLKPLSCLTSDKVQGKLWCPSITRKPLAVKMVEAV